MKNQYLSIVRPTPGVLAVLAFLGGAVVPSDVAAQAPATIELTGIVRDFEERTTTRGHPDFGVVPSKGFGHYQGNIDALLGVDGRPVFTGNGFKVNNGQQWEDSSGRPICYLLYDPLKLLGGDLTTFFF